MKKIWKDRIINIQGTDIYDNKFLFEYTDFDYASNKEVEVYFMEELLKEKKNEEILEKVAGKPAMYSNVYSPKDELEIFQELFDSALERNKKIHIVWITLREEIEILEKYYEELGFLREDINCFAPDFSVPLVTVSVNIENLMWKGSDYKRMKGKIFFIPPVRESGQVKAMFKGINRGVIAGIYMKNYSKQIEEFLGTCVQEEKILSITLAKVLKYNCEQRGFNWDKKEVIIKYE